MLYGKIVCVACNISFKTTNQQGAVGMVSRHCSQYFRKS